MMNLNPGRVRLSGASAELQRVLQTLSAVVDPGVGANVVELGLIESLSLTNDSAELTLVGTNANCPLSDLIADDVFRALQRALPERDLYVRHANDIEWTPRRMTPAARERLCWVAG
jgi:metal-sulfur cluster biosynthetic enzyme